MVNYVLHTGRLFYLMVILNATALLLMKYKYLNGGHTELNGMAMPVTILIWLWLFTGSYLLTRKRFRNWILGCLITKGP
jgi:hypothetical protein